MGNPLTGFPQSTDNANPAADLPPVNAYSPVSEADDVWNWTKSKSDEFGAWLKSVLPGAADFIKLAAALWSLGGELFVAFIKGLDVVEVDYIKELAKLYEQILPTAISEEAQIANIMLGLFDQAIQQAETSTINFGSGDLSGPLQTLYNSVIMPFTLTTGAANPQTPGSGVANMQYLLRQALGLNLANWIVDNAGDHLGLGWLKHLQPFVFTLDRSINPSNVVREAMDASYTALVKTPLVRDMNRAYPIKNLGLTSLAKLFLRTAIDKETYLDRCLDQGLDNNQAQQLILEAAKLLAPSDLALLLNHGYIGADDALNQLLWQGFPNWQANAMLWLEQHRRYFTIQDRVGTEAVTAWKAGRIDQPTLEALLQTLGYNSDEIQLLEVEGQFTKKHSDVKTLTLSDVKSLFNANLVSLDYVINFISNLGYSPDDTRLLVLLDFVKAEERSSKAALLDAKIRVEAEAALVAATKEGQKDQTALSQAKSALAAALNAYQHDTGELASLPNVMSLLGIGF